ncbi:MAG: biopolymer transporter ExbD, partial [Gammaproteobacteria bacterium]|nr:biopolymer transporter ExbD [Gammaproteobacteria bacterium]
MNLKPQRRDHVDVNLTPLIDVVFLLLIFFMVSTTFKHDAELKIDLPEASAKAVEQKKETIEIVIDAEGRYFINKQEVVNRKIETLKTAIYKISKGSNTIPFIIRADAKSPHQAFITAMDAAKQLGFVNLSIATT